MKSANIYFTAVEREKLLEIVKAAKLQAEECQSADDIPPHIFKKLIEKLEK